MLPGLRSNRVRSAIVVYQKVRGHRQLAPRSGDHVTEISEAVVIGIRRDSRLQPDAIETEEIGERGKDER